MAHAAQLEHTSIYTRDPNESEESDGEGGLGNLNRLIVRPPGHSGKAKRGHLCFDAAFETGNLGRADHINELEYDLFLRPDTCRPRSRFWFNFTVENVKQDQRVIFNIVNMGKDRTLFAGDMTPIVKSSSRQKWQRIPRRLVFYHRSVAHKGRRVLSLAFGFDREDDIYQFAAAAPYSYSRLQKHLALWEKRTQDFATRKVIAQTTQKRSIDLITIGHYDINKKEIKEEKDQITKGKNLEKKRVVLILSRVHGGEPPASFICQGFLDYMVGSSEKAIALRKGIVILVVPMLNPDGVFLGNQRSDLLGSDLNRCWNKATSFSHPGLVALRDVVKNVSSEKNLQLDFIIDLHADVSQEGVFVRGNSYDDVYRFERHAVLPKFLSARVEAWRPEICMYNADAGVAGSARRALPQATVDAYSLLVSLGGRRMTPRGPFIHYTEEACTSVTLDCARPIPYITTSDMKIGRSLVKSLCDYYRHIGAIPPKEGKPPKKQDNRRSRRRRRPVPDRERSASSSRERRVVRTRILSPPLPPASPPAARAPPPKPHRAFPHLARPRTSPFFDPLLPLITGVSVAPPRLSVVDLSAYIRAPGSRRTRRESGAPWRPRLARPARPSHARFSSDEYDTQDSDSPI